MAISLQYWASYTEGKTKLRRRSEDAVESNHVLKFLYDPDTKVLSSIVQASQRDRSYNIQVMLGDGYNVLLSKCGCALGLFECHHVAAALLYGYKNVAKTDVAQQWLKQPKSKNREVHSLAEIFSPNKPEYSFPESLKKRLCSEYNLEGVRAVQWGVTHEECAVAEYARMGFTVMPTGLWLHESGVLGASPDGTVRQERPCTHTVHYQTEEAQNLTPTLVEIKCPYTAANRSVLELVGSTKDFFLKQRPTGSLMLAENHKYYHQVQGQLHLTGQRCCDFVVWSPRDTVIVRIARNQNWAQNITKMIDFYFSTFIPSLPLA